MWRSVLPLLVSLSPAVLFLLHFPDCTFTKDVGCEDYKYGRQGSEDGAKPYCAWKCLLFTLQWPSGFCQSLNNRSLCMIPPSVNNWTIHGLWPVHAFKCCSCWPMFKSDVQDVEADLHEFWPSLLKKKSSYYFWKNEWEKHGACAACVEGLNSPLRYFQISLKLRQQFDIHKLLDEAGITPSCERGYKGTGVSTTQVSEVSQVLAPHFGKHHEIQCVTDVKDRQVWFQVKIPLSQNLTIGCDQYERDLVWTPSPSHPCPPDAPFYYLPIDHERPQRPCD